MKVTATPEEATYRAFFEELPLGLYLTTPDGRLTDANAALGRMLGFSSREALLAAGGQGLVGPPDREAWLEGLAQGRVVCRVRQQRRLDGALIWVEENVRALRGESGDIQCLIGSLEDVTERRRVEEALRESEERLRKIMESEPECVKLVAADGTVLDMNPAGLAMVEATRRDEVVGQSIYALISPAHHEVFRALTNAVFRGEEGIAEFEIRGLRGACRWMESRACPLRDSGGTVVAQLAVTRDVTERKRAEAALRESRARLASILDSAMDAIITLDADQRVVIFNAAAERMFLHSPEEAVGSPVERFIPERFRSTHREHVQTFGRSGSTTRSMAALGEVIGLRANGEEFPAEASISRIESGGQKLFTVILRDVTERKKVEVALRESRQEYAALLAGVDGIVWEADATTFRFSFVSQQAERILGYPVERWLQEPEFWREHLHPDDREQAVDACLTAVRQGRDHAYEYRMIAADGHAVWLRDMVSVVVEDGAVTKLRGILVDISDRRRMEDALAESEARFRALFEQSPFSTVLYRPDGSVLTVNDAFRSLWGTTGKEASELIGSYNISRDTVLEAAGLAPWVKRGFEQEFSELPPVHYGPGKTPLPGRTGTKDLWVKGYVYPVKDENGAVREVVLMHEDVTERQRAEEALRASEEKYRSFFEEDLAGNYVATPDGRLLACNPSFARIMGFDSVEAAQRHSLWSCYASLEARDTFLDKLRRLGRLSNHEHELRRRDGSVRRVIENAVGRFDEGGGLVEIQGYLIDDTERRKAEEQLRQALKIEAVGQLAGGVAHDFNNLLGVISGYCELLQKEIGVQHPGQSRLEQIREATDRAAGLTRQLLAFSRKQVLEPKIVNLNTVVADVEKMLRRLIGEDVHLVTVFEEALGSVKVDPGQVEQVIVNLAVNARDAMPRGGSLIIETRDVDLDEVYARTQPAAQAGPHVMLAVSDTGEGMDAETLSHVFEPFFTTKEQGKGTGLGLSTVHGIVKQSGGFVAAYSEPGQGSTFKVYFPRAEGVSHDAFGMPSGRGTAPGGTETILLVEDEASLRLVIGEFLQTAGYRVLQCATPAEALATARAMADPIHLMLTDVVLPGMSGRNVAERIQPQRPLMKVLYMSGYTDDAIANHGVLDPGTEFISKPFTANAVLRRVRDILDRPGL